MSQKVDQVDVPMAVEKQPEAAPVAVKKSVKEKKENASNEKKENAPKDKKPKLDKVSHPAHHPYFQMIKEALLALNERGGSSPHVIAKYMEEKHKDILPANYKKMLGVQLKNCAANEKLIKIKDSFKLSDESKKQKKVVPKTESVKYFASAVVGEKTKKRKKPTTSTKAKSTAVVVVPKSKTTVKKSQTVVVAPKKKKTVVPVKKVMATPAKKTGPANCDAKLCKLLC